MKKIIVAIFMAGLLLTTVLSAVSANTFTAEHIEPISYNAADKTGVERWAVIVGASGDIYGDYDAIDLNDTLVNHGWQADHIKLLIFPAYHDDRWYIEANKENIINAIRWMESKEDEDDIVLFFFSCHGGYKEIYVRWGTITCEELNNELNNFESNSMVIIFNSCFSGSMVSSPFVSSELMKEEQIEELYDNNVIGIDGTVEFMPALNAENEQISVEESGLESSGSDGLDKPGRVILMSSGRFEISWASYILQNGIFSYFLIEGFEGKADDVNQDGWISAEEAFKYAKPRTTLFARLKLITFQHPRIYDGYKGELNIVSISDQQNDPIQDQNHCEDSQNNNY